MANATEAAEPTEVQIDEGIHIHLEPYQIILRPLVTEKGMHRSQTQNQYAFEVNRLATKAQIRQAVEELFDVKVIKVCTQNRVGKARRYKFKKGRTKGWKKAVVTLHPENNINFF
jgi:large subunit ribosomal protein L23